MSKSERAGIGDDLKSGKLPAVVATSSLELGIDMGSIDLMVQVGCPRRSPPACSVSGAPDTGWMRSARACSSPPTAAICSPPRSPSNRCGMRRSKPRASPAPLDVLSQQIVAMVAMADWHVDELFDVVCRAAGYATLPRAAYDAVLDMLSGRYPSDDFAQLRPRIVWDRTTDMLTARQGAAHRGDLRRHYPRPRAVPGLHRGHQRTAGWANSTRKWSTSPGWVM